MSLRRFSPHRFKNKAKALGRISESETLEVLACENKVLCRYFVVDTAWKERPNKHVSPLMCLTADPVTGNIDIEHGDIKKFDIDPRELRLIETRLLKKANSSLQLFEKASSKDVSRQAAFLAHH